MKNVLNICVLIRLRVRLKKITGESKTWFYEERSTFYEELFQK